MTQLVTLSISCAIFPTMPTSFVEKPHHLPYHPNPRPQRTVDTNPLAYSAFGLRKWVRDRFRLARSRSPGSPQHSTTPRPYPKRKLASGGPWATGHRFSRPVHCIGGLCDTCHVVIDNNMAFRPLIPIGDATPHHMETHDDLIVDCVPVDAKGVTGPIGNHAGTPRLNNPIRFAFAIGTGNVNMVDEGFATNRIEGFKPMRMRVGLCIIDAAADLNEEPLFVSHNVRPISGRPHDRLANTSYHPAAGPLH